MLTLNHETIVALPVDQLGLEVLRDLIKTEEWNSQNYLGWAREARLPKPALMALAEAIGWLRGRALIARDPGQGSPDAVFVTRLGKRVAAEGLVGIYATDRIHGVHPLIEAAARPTFLLGQLDLSVFAAFKAIEVRVRELGSFGAELTGVPLMHAAFKQGGPLSDPGVPAGEQEGTRALFAGACGLLRNPVAHREVNYEDVGEAGEAVQTASLLMRMLDRVEKRLRPARP